MDANVLSDQRSAQAVVLPILAGITLLLNLPVLITHIQSHNLASSSLIFWIMIDNLFNFANPLIWPTDASLPLPIGNGTGFSGKGLCDIEVKLNIAASVGSPGALICIFIQLARILDTENTVLVPSKAQRLRRWITEGVLCWGLPLVELGLQWVVQIRRFYVFGVTGCYADEDSDWVTYAVVFLVPLVLCVWAGGLAGKKAFGLVIVLAD